MSTKTITIKSLEKTGSFQGRDKEVPIYNVIAVDTEGNLISEPLVAYREFDVDKPVEVQLSKQERNGQVVYKVSKPGTAARSTNGGVSQSEFQAVVNRLEQVEKKLGIADSGDVPF